MANFEEIDTARKTFGLGESATLEEIKRAYRRLASECHPDKLDDSDKKKGEEQFKKLTEARDVLMQYCAGYRFSFKKDDVEKVRSDRDFEYIFTQQFYDDWSVNL
jgi:hypothetical protein